MKEIKNDILLLVLTAVTVYLWMMTDFSIYYGFTIYLMMFIYLFIHQKPISHYLVVLLFSVMSDHTDGGTFVIDYVLSVILFGIVLIQSIRRRQIVLGKLFPVLLALLLYSMLSILWTPIRSEGWQGIVAMLQGYMIYLILTNGHFKVDGITISKIASFLMFTLTIQLFLLYHDLGIQAILADKLLIELGWGFSNLVAVVYTFGIPIAFYKYLTKNYYPHYFILDLLNGVGLLLTLSRGAMVGVGLVMVIYLFFTFKKQFIMKYYSIVAVIIGTIYFSDSLRNVIEIGKEQFVTKEFLNDNARYPLYQLGWDVFKANPIFGNGVKSSQYFINTVLFRQNVYFHNFILQIAATLGLVGLALLMIVLIRIILLYLRPKDHLVLCLGLGLAASLAHQLMDISYDRFFFGLFMYSIIAITELYRHYKEDDPYQLTTISYKKPVKGN
jgi:O-antigen ligase